MNKPEQRNRWTKQEIELLKKAYSSVPYKVPRILLERHGASGCHTKASKLKFSKGIRSPGVDLSHLTEAEKGYIAGYLDGEGSIVISMKGRDVNPTLQWNNTHKPSIDWLKKKLRCGGIAVNRRSHIASRLHDCFMLHVTGVMRTYDILVALEPYLIIKRQKAKSGLCFLRKKYPLLFTDIHTNLNS